MSRDFRVLSLLIWTKNYSQIDLKMDQTVQKEIGGKRAFFLRIFSENMHCIIAKFWYNSQVERFLENRSKKFAKEVKT